MDLPVIALTLAALLVHVQVQLPALARIVPQIPAVLHASELPEALVCGVKMAHLLPARVKLVEQELESQQ